MNKKGPFTSSLSDFIDYYIELIIINKDGNINIMIYFGLLIISFGYFSQKIPVLYI